MKRGIAAFLLLLPLISFSKDEKKSQQAKEDIVAHRAIAAAHEKAAKCLEAGRTEKECHAHLAADCKAYAIGKYCGMRHKH